MESLPVPLNNASTETSLNSMGSFISVQDESTQLLPAALPAINEESATERPAPRPTTSAMPPATTAAGSGTTARNKTLRKSLSINEDAWAQTSAMVSAELEAMGILPPPSAPLAAKQAAAQAIAANKAAAVLGGNDSKAELASSTTAAAEGSGTAKAIANMTTPTDDMWKKVADLTASALDLTSQPTSPRDSQIPAGAVELKQLMVNDAAQPELKRSTDNDDNAAPGERERNPSSKPLLPADSKPAAPLPPPQKPSEAQRVSFANDKRPSDRSLAESATPSGPHASSLYFHTGLVYMFMTGMVLCIIYLVLQIAFLYVLGAANIPLPGVFQSMNLIVTAWFGFGFFFVCSYAPNLWIIRTGISLTSLGCILAAVVASNEFNTLAAGIFAIPAAVFLLALPLSHLIEKRISSLPVYELSLQTWVTTLRYFAIIVAPMIAILVNTGKVDLDAYFAVVLFCVALAYYNTLQRVHLGLLPFSPIGVSTSFNFLTLRHLIIGYVPPFVLLLAFSALYILNLSKSNIAGAGFVSGSGNSTLTGELGATPTASPTPTQSPASKSFIVAIVAISGVMMAWMAAFLTAFLTRFRILAWINPFTTLDYRALRSAAAYAKASHVDSTEPDAFHGIQAKLREDLDGVQEQLIAIESTLTALRAGFAFTRIMLWIFIVGAGVMVAVLILELVLVIGYGVSAQSVWCNLLNIIGTGWMIFGFLYTISYSTSALLINVYCGLVAVTAAMLAVWASYAFGVDNGAGVMVVVLYALLALTMPLMAIIAKRMYKMVARLPVEDMTLQQWFTSFRFFALVTAPLLAKYIQYQAASAVSFLSLVVFCLALSLYCSLLRVHFAIKPPVRGGIAGMFQSLSIGQLVQTYTPIAIMLFVFALLYMIEISGQSSVVPSTIVIIFVALALGAIVWHLVNVFAFVRVPLFVYLSPFTTRDYQAFKTAIKRTVKIEEAVESGGGDGILMRQRKVLRQRLQVIESDIADADENAATMRPIISIAVLLVYAFAAQITLIIPIWIAQVVIVYIQPVETAYVQQPGFWTFSLLSVGSASIGGVYSAGYAPSSRLIMYILAMTGVLCTLVAAWSYRVFSTPAMIIFVFVAAGFMVAASIRRQLYMRIAVLPVDDLSMQVFFTCMRFLLLLCTPIISRYFSSQYYSDPTSERFSQESFFAVFFYSAAVTQLVSIVRLYAAIYPAARTVMFIMRQLTTRQLVIHFIPFFAMVLVFITFYVIEVSRSAAAIPEGAVIGLLVFGLVALSVYLQQIFSFALRFEHPLLAKLNAYTDEEYEFLDAARARRRDRHFNSADADTQRS